MEPITFWRCVTGAWQDGVRFVRRRPLCVAGIFLAAWLTFPLEIALLPDRQPAFRAMTYLPLVAFELLKFALFSVLTVEALRFVLLDGAANGTAAPVGRDYQRYLGFMCGLGIVSLVILAIAGALGIALGMLVMIPLMPHSDRALILVPIVFGCVALLAVAGIGFVWARFNLLCTHVAIGRTARLRDAWDDTRGHCWSIWLSQLVSTLPFYAVSAWLTSRDVPDKIGLLTWTAEFLASLATIAAICISASCAAWLYRRYASAMVMHAIGTPHYS